jgi:arylsulfatase A-like enzyme
MTFPPFARQALRRAERHRSELRRPLVGLVRRVRRWLSTILATGLVATLGSCGTVDEPQAVAANEARTNRPNVILIVVDDLGYGDIGAYDGDIPTPNIDAIARSGTRYTAAYSTAPICSPSRAGLLSGRFQGRFGFYFNLVGRETGMPSSETTLAEVAKQADYRTGMVGKWHVGEGAGIGPLDQGFDSFYGFMGGATSYFPDGTEGLITANTGPDHLITREKFPILDGRTVVRPTGNITDVFTDKALEFISSSRERPFFLYLAYNAPHTPLQATAEEVAPFADDPSPFSRVYKAMMATLDKNIGRLTDTLRSLGLDKNTIVIFVSDNGCPNYDRGACTNAPFSGWKAFPLEGGTRIPYIVNWPGHIEGGRVSDEPTSTLDIMPTIAAAIGRPAPAGSEGRNLLAATGPQADRPLFWRMGPNHWTRQGQWKLITINKAADTQDLSEITGKALTKDLDPHSSFGQWDMLFNLYRDPAEQYDVGPERQQIVERMTGEFEEWDRSNVPPVFPSRREFRTEMNGKKVQLIF